MNKKIQIIVLLVAGCITVLFFVLNNDAAKQEVAPQEKYSQVNEFSTKKEAFLKQNKDLNEKLVNVSVPEIVCQDDSSEYNVKKHFTIFKRINNIKLPIFRIPHDAFSVENTKQLLSKQK